MPPQFSLTVQSFVAPDLPPVPKDIDHSLIKSPLIPNVLSPTSPLHLQLLLPCARESDFLYPATHLQFSYHYEGTGESIGADLITSREVVRGPSDEKVQDHFVYHVEVPPTSILRVKVNHGETPDADMRVRAWKNEKLLGMWTIGRIPGLGLEGFKSEPIHRLRVAQWKATLDAGTKATGS